MLKDIRIFSTNYIVDWIPAARTRRFLSDAVPSYAADSQNDSRRRWSL